jgi:hypothetical protein
MDDDTTLAWPLAVVFSYRQADGTAQLAVDLAGLRQFIAGDPAPAGLPNSSGKALGEEVLAR